jgi:hypothetical protein
MNRTRITAGLVAMIAAVAAFPALAAGKTGPSVLAQGERITKADTSPSKIDGTYTTSYTRAQFLPLAFDRGENNPGNWGSFRLVLKGGRFTYTQLNGHSSSARGTYMVAGNRITLRPQTERGVWIYTWRLSTDGKLLSFKKAKREEPTGFIVKPWRKV